MFTKDGNSFLPKEDERCNYLITKGEDIITERTRYTNLSSYFCMKHQIQLSVVPKAKPRQCQNCPNFSFT